jgi:hypothetical protein
VRRPFIYIEHLIGECVYWAVLEPKRARMEEVDTTQCRGRARARAEVGCQGDRIRSTWASLHDTYGSIENSSTDDALPGFTVTVPKSSPTF